MQTNLLEKLALRVPLNRDTEEQRLANKVRKAVFKIKSKQKAKKSIYSNRGGLISMGARGVYVKDGDLYSRKVIVKAKYIKNNNAEYDKKFRKHIDYISRNGADKEGQKPELFSKEDRDDLLKNPNQTFTNAPHHFRFIISPEDGDKLDLKDFTRDLINNIEKDLETKIQWFAACHYDTNEPHVHLVINGRDELGKKLLMTRDYISRGIRNRSSQVINKKLGLRQIEDIIKSLEVDSTKSKKCELDKIILSNIKNGQVDADYLNKQLDLEIPENIFSKRLEFLKGQGLASSINGSCWQVNQDYLKVLGELNKQSGVRERLYGDLRIGKENCIIVSPEGLKDAPIEGTVIARGFVHEISDEEYLVIENKMLRYYLELEKHSEKIASKVGDYVKISTIKHFQAPKASDLTIIKFSEANGRVYDAAMHEAYVRQHVSLPAGVSAKDYIQSHLKRLEVLARMEFVKKVGDKKYLIPSNFLKILESYALSAAKNYRPHIKVEQIPAPKIEALNQNIRLKQ